MRTPGLMVKRFVDIVVAFCGLLMLSPLIVLIYLVIRIRLGRPVVFRQHRPGYKGRPFYVYKFRTMMRSAERHGKPLDDGERMGRLGKLLRRTSLDELPQFVNVLKGEMSLVGPRPLLMQYLDLYTPEQMRRHDVRPGITGLAQVSGRNILSWEERFQIDVWYVDNWTLWLDLRILLLSIAKVLPGEGVSQPGHATMRMFTGDDNRDR